MQICVFSLKCQDEPERRVRAFQAEYTNLHVRPTIQNKSRLIVLLLVIFKHMKIPVLILSTSF